MKRESLYSNSNFEMIYLTDGDIFNGIVPWSVDIIYFALMSIFLSVKYNQTKIQHLLSHLPLQRFEDKHSQTPETRCNTLH